MESRHKKRARTFVSHRALALGLSTTAMAAVLSSAGCGESEGGASDPACVSTREYFTTEVYGKALATCAGCHTPGGQADQQGAKFKMFRDTYPDFVTANLNAMRSFAKIEYEDTPMILVKPLGELNHGGGAVLTKGSPEYQILQKFVSDLRAGRENTCDGDGQLGVQYLGNQETARKAAILLAGRVPNDQELGSVIADEGLDAFVLGLTREEPFYDLLHEIWNDALLTDRGIDANAGNTFNNGPQLYDDRYPGYSTENRTWASASVTEEPLRFIEYVVRNDRPFSDVVAGNYVVANPYMAKMYGLPHDKPMTPENYLEWQRIDYSPVQNQMVDDAPRTIGMPTAGVLSTPAFLSRWETTPTNRGRKRARIVLKNFLATDIFKFANRPVDSTALTSVQNPTSNSPMCSVCHKVIDPIAGGFRGFGEQNLLRFDAADPWHDDMVPPGLNTTQMPPSNYGNAIMWLGAQIPKDPRFGIAIAQVMYKGIIGDDPLSFPTDKAAPDYAERVRAFNIQNDWFVRTGAEFVANDYDLRKLVLAVVKSAYFRASTGEAGKDALHEGLGQGRLLTPEMLGRKYKATTGLYFFRNGAADDDVRRSKDGFLRSDLIADRDWRLVYGGIDSGDVTKRTDTMSPLMLATSQYTGAIVACRATSYDFTKPQAERRLFRFVEMTDTPFTVRANETAQLVAVPGTEDKIRENIKYLFFRLLGENVDAHGEEVNGVFSLFVDTWKDFENQDFTGDNAKGLTNYRCVAENDWDKGVRFEPNDQGNLEARFVELRDRPQDAPYEPGMRLDRDENFTVRAWQAVMTYLLTDYRFTHE